MSRTLNRERRVDEVRREAAQQVSSGAMTPLATPHDALAQPRSIPAALATPLKRPNPITPTLGAAVPAALIRRHPVATLLSLSAALLATRLLGHPLRQETSHLARPQVRAAITSTLPIAPTRRTLTQPPTHPQATRTLIAGQRETVSAPLGAWVMETARGREPGVDANTLGTPLTMTLGRSDARLEGQGSRLGVSTASNLQPLATLTSLDPLTPQWDGVPDVTVAAGFLAQRPVHPLIISTTDVPKALPWRSEIRMDGGRMRGSPTRREATVTTRHHHAARSSQRVKGRRKDAVSPTKMRVSTSQAVEEARRVHRLMNAALSDAERLISATPTHTASHQ